jgi:hypothetical protein
MKKRDIKAKGRGERESVLVMIGFRDSSTIGMCF